MYIVEWQDKSDNRMDLNWFKHSFHQIAKLTNYAIEGPIEERDLSQAERLYSVYFATHLCNACYNQRSKVVENACQ